MHSLDTSLDLNVSTYTHSLLLKEPSRHMGFHTDVLPLGELEHLADGLEKGLERCM